MNPAYVPPAAEYQGVRVQGARDYGDGSSASGAAAPTQTRGDAGLDDAIEVALKRNGPNVRAGIVLDNEFLERAVVKSVQPGSPAAATHESLSTVMWLRPRDEIFAIDGVRVTSAKHTVQLIRQSNKLQIVVLKSRKPIPAPPPAVEIS
eukprot:4967408-Prymnesium_polylepis.1